MAVTYPRKFLNALSARDVMNRVVHDPEIHHITLNRYRYNEQRSCKDLTDLIETLNGKPADLVKDLSHHVSDEARHAVWLTDLLVDLGVEISTPPGLSYIDEFERLLDQDSLKDANDPETSVIAALASINVTEKRGCEYFAAHIHALKSAPQTPENIKIRETLERILPEEAGHVRWGTRRLAEIARKSPAHRERVELAKRKYTAIEQTAFESGMDITLGAELRRVSNLLDIANTLPVWERPGYLLERLPATLLAPEVQKTRLTAAQKAWQRDPETFIKTFLPMFLAGVQKPAAKPSSQVQNATS
ncbi:ferritin-like domain-containing protein [Nodosilinea sp. LEGE 07088]|uniref:ferritin-like domain-containing protein n=1 Tax=Nodosilinea sp. LEGE 07088 TaxID=2777968 RepID=UPI00187E8FD1|nr:ferritin-like domain-containing protein [Nodosilinea sp. LEGE 07088]MBE9136261.1 ferritin-like domain-containing protein [Nodosilinea sp. LEGE 07088]